MTEGASNRSADKVDSLKVDLPKSRLVQKLNTEVSFLPRQRQISPTLTLKSTQMWPELETEVKFAAAAANVADFNAHRLKIKPYFSF